MIRALRVLVAALSVAGMAFCFAFPAAALAWHLDWLPRVQFVPALFAGSFLVAAAVVVSVLLFGRLYCSVVCPLGIVQDLFRFLFPSVPKRRPPARCVRWIRTFFFALFAAALYAGYAQWLEPYGIFGRTLSLFASPDFDVALPVLAATLGLFLAILLLTLVRERFWCTYVCPVGTVLGHVARHAVLRPRVSAAKCVNCNACVRACKAGAIPEGRDKKVDASLCLACGNCLGTCRVGALRLVCIPSEPKSTESHVSA